MDFDAVTRLWHELDLQLGPNVPYTDYQFLALEDLSHLSSQEIDFLKSQGCFDIPSKPILDQFIHQYFLHVHPILPQIDEKIFWDLYMGSIQDNSKSAGISLFLFQAMIFAASSFVPPSVVNDLNLSHPHQAATTFYRRAKLLFDFECVADPMSIAQGSLLLSTHQTQRHHTRRTNTFWLGIAIQNTKLALAQYCRYSHQSIQRIICKRLWWCCVVRDRSLALGLRVPLQITPDCLEANIDMLTSHNLQSDIEHSKVYSSGTKRLLVDLFVGQCELAVKLTRVIMLSYPTNERSPSMQTVEDEHKLGEDLAAVEEAKSGLAVWYESAMRRFPTPAGLGDTDPSIVLYTNLLYIIFYSGRLALGHYEILLSQSGAVQDDVLTMPSKGERCMIQDSITSIAEHTKELVQLRLARYLPFNAMALITLPLVLHAVDVAISPSESLMALKQHRLNIFLELTKIHGLQYDGLQLIREVIHKTVACIKFKNTRMDSWPFAIQNAHPPQKQPSSLLEAPEQSQVSICEWGEMVSIQPRCYLRLALTIDLAFSRGKFPDNADFPVYLQENTAQDIFAVGQNHIVNLATE
ncbi:hypothetical protein DL98DRAFT_427572 [Cadophora sp. DSE1049]|nr:hypothetical protein DL98DRAFT_427572 [Cadophora sp. DSE1049]